MTPFVDKRGYHRVILRKPGSTTPYGRTVHRLVALAFLPNPENLSDVAHRDGQPSNNLVSNLRWASHQDNQRDMLRHGTAQCGEKSYTAKLTNAQVEDIRERAQVRGAGAALAKEYGISKAQVSRIKNGFRWGHLTPSPEG